MWFMKIKLSILLVSTSFLFACSPSEDASSVQHTQKVEVEVADLASNNDLIPIPISDSFENGRYFLTSQVTEDGVNNIEYIRKGNDNTSYTKMEIRCTDNQIRKHSADNVDALQSADMGDWITPTPDWTDQDIINFICD